MNAQYAFLENDQRIIYDSQKNDYSINATTFKIQCDFLSVHIILPHQNYEDPFIKADNNAILKYPHIESNGKLCLPVFPNDINKVEEKVKYLLDTFFDNYLPKIKYTDCFQDYMQEASHYWSVFIDLYKKKNNLTKISCPNILLCHNKIKRASVFLEYNSKLIEQSELIIVDNQNEEYGKKIIDFFSKGKNTLQNIRTLEIQLNNALLPSKFPNNQQEIKNFIGNYVGKDKASNFIANKKKSLLILRSATCDYAYLINYLHKKFPKSSKIPIPSVCDKIDLEWIYGRYQNKSINLLKEQHILCFGAGVLGSYVLPLLIREGIGEITLVDDDIFDTANLARHFLGIDSLWQYKVDELKEKLRNLPTCKINPNPIKAKEWLEKNKKNLHNYNLIVDLTGSLEVREALNSYRKECDYQKKLVTGWMEPYVCAGHVAIFAKNIFWSKSKWESLAAFHEWPDKYLVNEPGCASKFQPYSGIQANRIASLITSKIIDSIKTDSNDSLVFSLIQNEDYCAQQPYEANRQKWAEFNNEIESIILKREILS